MAKKSTVDKLPGNKRSIGQNRFHWTSADGVEIDLPKFEYQSPARIKRVLLASRSDDPVDKLDAVGHLCDKEDMRVILLELPMPEIERLMRAMTRQTDKDLLEKSGASPTS